MDLMKLQNLLNECIMIEQGNCLGGNFSIDLAEAQAELNQVKQLLIPLVSQQRKLLIAFVKYGYDKVIKEDLDHIDDFIENGCN